MGLGKVKENHGVVNKFTYIFANVIPHLIILFFYNHYLYHFIIAMTDLQIVQFHPVAWSGRDQLCAYSRAHAISLLRTRWYALIDDQGNCIVPNQQETHYVIPIKYNSIKGQLPKIIDRVPDISLFQRQTITFFRLNTNIQSGKNWCMSQVNIYYITPKTKFVQVDSCNYHPAKTMRQAIQYPKRPVQNVGGVLFNSRL